MAPSDGPGQLMYPPTNICHWKRPTQCGRRILGWLLERAMLRRPASG